VSERSLYSVHSLILSQRSDLRTDIMIGEPQYAQDSSESVEGDLFET